MNAVILALCIVAGILAVLEIVRKRDYDFLPWAVLLIAAVLVIERVT